MKTNSVPATLLAFLAEWYEWVNNGAPYHDTFTRRFGLCAGYYTWCNRNAYVYDGLALKLAFMEEGLDLRYPFGENNYDKDVIHMTMHQDPARIAWVKSVLDKNGVEL